MTTLSECNDCWYVPGTKYIIDVIDPETGRTFCMGKDEADILAEAPQAKRMTVLEASDEIDRHAVKAFCRPVSECTAADFNYALEVLPPAGWKTARGVQSFKMSERTFGDITEIFAECGGRYFVLADRISLPASEIAERVGNFIAANPASNPTKHFEWL